MSYIKPHGLIFVYTAVLMNSDHKCNTEPKKKCHGPLERNPCALHLLCNASTPSLHKEKEQEPLKFMVTLQGYTSNTVLVTSS